MCQRENYSAFQDTSFIAKFVDLILRSIEDKKYTQYLCVSAQHIQYPFSLRNQIKEDSDQQLAVTYYSSHVQAIQKTLR